MIVAPTKKEGKDSEKPSETYHVKISSYVFEVKRLDDKGKPIPSLNALSGHIMIGNELQFIEDTYAFLNIASSEREGYLSIYPIFSDTPKEVVKRLKELNEQDPEVLTQKQYEEEENPARFAEQQLRLKVEAEKEEIIKNAQINKEKAVDKAVAAKDKEHGKALKEMQKRLDDMEKKQEGK